MAHNPITRDPIRVHDTLLPFLTFGWPGGADPGGIFGYQAPTSYSTFPKRFSVSASNSPIGNSRAFTVTAVVTVSGTSIPTTAPRVVSTARLFDNGGMDLYVNSGIVGCGFYASSGDAATGLTGSLDTRSGQTFTLMAVHNPPLYEALYAHGTLVGCHASVQSWTTQHTFNIGWDGGTKTWSGGLRDVYVFAKALTPAEVGVQHHWMK